MIMKPPLGPLAATWYSLATAKVETAVETTEAETLPLHKDSEYDEEEEGEIRESEGRWKR